MKFVGNTIELSYKQFNILQDICGSSVSLQNIPADKMFKKVFKKHGGYEDYVRNGFLCPLLDRLKYLGTIKVFWKV